MSRPPVMRCVACGRALTKFAITIPTREGLVGWGPVCAKRVTIRPTRTKYPVIEVADKKPKPVRRDQLTRDWIEEARPA